MQRRWIRRTQRPAKPVRAWRGAARWAPRAHEARRTGTRCTMRWWCLRVGRQAARQSGGARPRRGFYQGRTHIGDSPRSDPRRHGQPRPRDTPRLEHGAAPVARSRRRRRGASAQTAPSVSWSWWWVRGIVGEVCRPYHGAAAMFRAFAVSPGISSRSTSPGAWREIAEPSAPRPTSKILVQVSHRLLPDPGQIPATQDAISRITSSIGTSVKPFSAPTATSAIASRTGKPSTSTPNTAYCPSRNGCGPSHR